METGRLLILIIVILGIFAAFYFLVIPGEKQLLDSLVSTGPDISLDDWLGTFEFWAIWGVIVALVAAFFWYFLGQWIFKLNYWNNANKNKRWIWVGLLIGSLLLAVVPSDLRTPDVQEWNRLATVLYGANTLFVYYVVTLFWSPSSFKYMPVGAVTLRRYW